MSWEKSEIMREYFRISEEQGLVKSAAPEKNPNQEDLKTIEEKRLKKTEKSIIEIAHPNPVYIAEARGDGGLVENEVEQQKKTIEIINKMPTGSLVGRYAKAINTLIKMAGDLDEIGAFDFSDLLYSRAMILVDRIDDLPFDKAPAQK